MYTPVQRRATFASVLLVAPLVAACGGPPAPRSAADPVEVGAFVVRLGADTVALEEFSRSGSRIQGRQLVRAPRTSIREYSGTLRDDGTLERFEIRFRDTPEAEPTTHAQIEWADGGATVRVNRQGTEQTFRNDAGAGSLPFVGYSVALYELALARMRSADLEAAELAMIPIGAEGTYPLRLERHGRDSVIVHNLAGANLARVDPDGRLLSWDGMGSTLAITADRDVTLDITRYAREYAERDAAGRGLGALSPRDSVSARVGDVAVTIAYGRPAARGRQVFGGVVPWGQVWRTGANQVTILRTDGDLMIGDARIPAGSYSLFSIPSPDGWELIVNRQTGQWGTDHDPAQDLARVRLRHETVETRLEQFTIELEPRGEREAELRLAWDDARATVGVRAP
jgi:hypothetical protein